MNTAFELAGKETRTRCNGASDADIEFMVRRDLERNVLLPLYLAGLPRITAKLERGAPLPPAVARAIDEAIERRPDPWRGGLSLSVKKGSVRIAGTVRSPGEKNALLRAARGVPGVLGIEDDLRVAMGA